jgi:hypothetical protein
LCDDSEPRGPRFNRMVNGIHEAVFNAILDDWNDDFVPLREELKAIRLFRQSISGGGLMYLFILLLGSFKPYKIFRIDLVKGKVCKQLHSLE